MADSAQVVLVHGLWMTGREMGLLARRLHHCGFVIGRTHYFSLRTRPRDSARRLYAYVESLEADVVHFVAHSLGGLIVCWLLHDFPVRPGRVVMIGTPYQGSCVAARLATSRYGRWLVGNSIDRGLLGDAAPWRAERELGVIAGVARFGVGRLFARLPTPHDGTVAVAETQVPGMTDFITIHASHTGLLFSSETARQVCSFLHHGRFSDPAREAV